MTELKETSKYIPENKTLRDYCENNEAEFAQVGNPIMISVYDCDIVAQRTRNDLIEELIDEIKGMSIDGYHSQIMSNRQWCIAWLKSKQK